ncbi:MAG: D-amino acid dehydrogenase [Pseudomonadales bacterium]
MKVLVVGAGVTGICTAYYLQGLGAEVSVVEQLEGPALDCSFANGGGIHASVADPWNSPGVAGMLLKYFGRKDAPLLLRSKALLPMAAWGINFLRHSKEELFLRNTQRNDKLANYSLGLMKEIRDDCGVEYRADFSGMLKIFRDNETLDAVRKLADFLSGEREPKYQVLSSTETIGIEPSLAPVRDKITGGLHFPDDESGDSHLFCQNLAKILADRGVMFHYNCEVSRLKKHGSTFEAQLTEADPLNADAVVIAAGSYSPQLARSFGLHLPIKPAKGYSLTIPMHNWKNRPSHLMADMGLHAGLNPLGGEVLRVAGTAEFAGYDRSIPADRIKNLIGLVEGIFPEFAATMDREQLNPWTGFRPMTYDGVPLLGKTTVPGLYLNTGHGHLGWTMAAGSGRVVAETILGKETALEMNNYSPSRL